MDPDLPTRNPGRLARSWDYLGLLKRCNMAFKSDNLLCSTTTADLRRGIKEAKGEYRNKIETNLQDDNPCRVWQAIQQLTNYKGSPSNSITADVSLCEELISSLLTLRQMVLLLYPFLLLPCSLSAGTCRQACAEVGESKEGYCSS